MIHLDHVIAKLRQLGSCDVKEVKKKFGIQPIDSFGIFLKDLKRFAQTLPRDDHFAMELFESGQYEARLLVPMLFDPRNLNGDLMDTWAAAFSTWEECDTYCMGFFGKSDFAYEKAFEWIRKSPTYIRRAGFVCMVSYAFTNKFAMNREFISFLPEIKRYSTDSRIYVKKGINWALRQIGKRNKNLLKEAIQVAEELVYVDNSCAKWIGTNALRQLKSSKVYMKNYPIGIYR